MDLLDELEENKKFRQEIKYSRQLPEMFSTEDINATSENMTFAILGELRDRYKEGEPVTFTYQELAELGGLWFKRKNGKKSLYNGKKLQEAMYHLNDALKNFAYYQVRDTNEDGTPKSWKTINIFSVIDFDGTKREVKLTISNAEINPQQVDAQGNIINEPLHVYDLINSKDWSKVKHLKYDREINNNLPSKYSKRIYRFISEFRNFPKGTKMRIDDFDKKILKILKTEEEVHRDKNELFDLRKNRKKYLDKAVKEIQELTTPEGEQIIKNLDYIYYYSGRKIHSIEFTFTPFNGDLTHKNKLSSVVKNTPKGKRSPFLEDAKTVLNYLNYLHSIRFEYNIKKQIYELVPKNGEGIYFDVENKVLLKPILSLLENGVPVDELMQIEEMKAFEWRDNAEVLRNLKPSVLFGDKYSEYRAYLNYFRNEYQVIFDKNKSKDFYIPMDGPWNSK
ncbi:MULTISPECIES: replication initiation protein [Lactococcus]|uniref:replication initiation protein n=1 Tax=Lactococcus TaxID=1357 RepID=UPI00203F7222|nr:MULTISPECIES: replication initiation protein [Lactococcus]